MDIDDRLLEAAKAELGTQTIKATVNEALRQAGRVRGKEIKKALDGLADLPFADRSDAWR